MAIDLLKDRRVNCLSVMSQTDLKTYLEMVKIAYENRGGIDHQREQLRTTSAVRIRSRMVDDIARGAVLPPIVIGLVVNAQQFRQVQAKMSEGAFHELVSKLHADQRSIIDGMQRTTALFEASQKNYKNLPDTIRVEYWISESTNNLIYRMLVLNTGQVPWNLRRQIEVVFRSLVRDLKALVPKMSLLESADHRPRVKGGQLQSDDLIELFLVFGARKEKIDIRERLADEFTRLDFVEATSEETFTPDFAEVVSSLVALDIAFDLAKKSSSASALTGRFQRGRDIFSSQPACVGFVTAAAHWIYGRPGINRGRADQEARKFELVQGTAKLVGRLAHLDAKSMREFLALDTLRDAISRPPRSGVSVGDAEREFFLEAFKVLIEEKFALDDMGPCWRAY